MPGPSTCSSQSSQDNPNDLAMVVMPVGSGKLGTVMVLVGSEAKGGDWTGGSDTLLARG